MTVQWPSFQLTSILNDAPQCILFSPFSLFSPDISQIPIQHSFAADDVINSSLLRTKGGHQFTKWTGVSVAHSALAYPNFTRFGSLNLGKIILL